MRKITAGNIVSAIAKLPQNNAYDYANPKTQTKIEILNVQLPEGPIVINRYDPSKGEGPRDGKAQSISSQMIWRIANALSENKPINFDRILGASYNTRSAFEALLLHTPEFYLCKPGRIQVTNSTTDIEKGHKHVLWLPNEPHPIGGIYTKDTDIVISEFSSEAVYEALDLPSTYQGEELTIEMSRRHVQIQIALIKIGEQLGFRTWIANNDKGITYNDTRIGEMKGVVPRLQDEKLLSAYSEAVKAALLIDCIWFRNSHFMPAVLEVEHSTGVTSGLSRMKHFYDQIPRLQDVRWTIVAPDEDREKVMKEANKPQFRDLQTQFMPYSSVEELYSLCQRRKIRGINDAFLDCFMEPCLGNA
jgi:hypothetical protein